MDICYPSKRDLKDCACQKKGGTQPAQQDRIDGKLFANEGKGNIDRRTHKGNEERTQCSNQ